MWGKWSLETPFRTVLWYNSQWKVDQYFCGTGTNHPTGLQSHCSLVLQLFRFLGLNIYYNHDFVGISQSTQQQAVVMVEGSICSDRNSRSISIHKIPSERCSFDPILRKWLALYLHFCPFPLLIDWITHSHHSPIIFLLSSWIIGWIPIIMAMHAISFAFWV